MANVTSLLTNLCENFKNPASTSRPGTLPSQTVTNPRQQINAITTMSKYWKNLRPYCSYTLVSILKKEPELEPGDINKKVQNPNWKMPAHVPSPGKSIHNTCEIPKPKAKKPLTLKSRSQFESILDFQPRADEKIGLKDALVEMPKFNKWLSSLLRNKEKLEEIAITTVNAECSAIIMNRVPEKLEDPRKFLIPCALQDLDRTSALADSGASINLLPHSIYKKLGLEALTSYTNMTLELANHFVVVNFEPDPRVPIILGRPFLRTAKALIDLYEEKLTLRVGKDELVYYTEKSTKNKEKNFVHAISIIDFSKDDPFSGSTTTHSNDPPPSASPMKTSDNFEKFADELAPLDSLPPGNDKLTLKKDLHKENIQDLSKPLLDEMEENVEIKKSNVSDELVLLNTPLSDKIESFAPEDNNDEIDDFLAIEVSSNFEEGYFDSEGDVTFLDSLLSDDDSHNLVSEVITNHEPLPLSTFQSQGNIHQTSVIESLPYIPTPVEDRSSHQEESDIFPVRDDLISPVC
ncbi:reverse transcriptase domain-containing protein [Tanacetum coccineum]